MDAALTTILGIASIALVSRIVFDWLRGRKQNGNGTLLRQIREDVSWTRSIHERFDADGSPLWYVPRSWKDDLDRLNKGVAESNVLLEKILEQLRSRPV